jgi:hypothetical protein
MRRELGTFETALTLTGRHAPFVVVVVLELAGGPSPERLRLALDALQRRHPPLAARIVERKGRFRFEPDGTPPIPLEVEPRSKDGRWAEVAESELDRPIDAEAGPLLRCVYLAPAGAGGPAEIVLTLHHAVIDAASAALLAGELLGLCAGPAEGAGGGVDQVAGPTAGPEDGPPPLESLFPAGLRGARGRLRRASFVARQLADELRYRLRPQGVGAAADLPPAPDGARNRVLSARLSAAATGALARRARRERVTLNSVLAAAFLLTVQGRLHGGRSGPMRYLTFADLRLHLAAPLPAERLGCAISMLRYTAALPAREPSEARTADGELWPLAHAVNAQVAAGFRRGDKFCAALLAEPTMRWTLGQRSRRMAASAVSYTGPLRLGPPCRGVRAFVSNVPVGPEYTAQARLFAGELLLDVVYLDADLEPALARAVLDDALASLEAAGGEE